MPYCTNCGNLMDENASFCQDCGKASQTKNESFSEKLEREANKFVMNKDPFIAAILSFVFPGLGQVYNGDLKKGLAVQIGFIISLLFGGIFPLFFLIPLGVLLTGVYDAYTEADKIRKGELPNKKPTLNEILIFILCPVILAVVLFIILLVLAVILAILGIVIASPFRMF